MGIDGHPKQVTEPNGGVALSLSPLAGGSTSSQDSETVLLVMACLTEMHHAIECLQEALARLTDYQTSSLPPSD